MTLAQPGWLHLLWGLPLLLALAVLAARARSRGLAQLFASGMWGDRIPPGLARRRAWTTMLALVGLALAASAASQPRWGFSWRELKSEGIEVVLVLDVSRSMDAADVEPSRLERARREILDLLSLMPTDGVGLVIFAAGAYPRVPITRDHDALVRIVRGTDSGTIQAQGSSLASGLVEGITLFRDDRKSDRAMVVLSDGELWDPSLADAVTALQEAEVRVYALGIGTANGAPIPVPGGGFKKDSGGSVVLSQLQEEALQKVASATGGSYLRSVPSADDVQVLADRLHRELTAAVTTVKRDKIWDERFQWPLAAGLGLLLLGGLLGDGRSRGRVVGLALLGLLAAEPAHAGGLEEAQVLLEQGKSAEAVETLTRLQVEQPDDPGVVWTLGRALYEDGRFDEASRVFTDLADRSPDSEHSLGSRYNAGLSHYGAGRLDEAVENWDRVLEQEPDNEAARQNAEAVRQELARRAQEPPPEDQDGEDGDPSEGGDTGASEPQDGEPGDTGEAGEPAEPSEEPDSDDGTREDSQQAEGAGEEGEPEGEIESVEGSGDTGAPAVEEALPEGVQEISAEEASRLLESVDEGNPRVTVRGRNQEKDW